MIFFSADCRKFIFFESSRGCSCLFLFILWGRLFWKLHGSSKGIHPSLVNLFGPVSVWNVVYTVLELCNWKFVLISLSYLRLSESNSNYFHGYFYLIFKHSPFPGLKLLLAIWIREDSTWFWVPWCIIWYIGYAKVWVRSRTLVYHGYTSSSNRHLMCYYYLWFSPSILAPYQLSIWLGSGRVTSSFFLNRWTMY